MRDTMLSTMWCVAQQRMNCNASMCAHGVVNPPKHEGDIGLVALPIPKNTRAVSASQQPSSRNAVAPSLCAFSQPSKA
eukprot:1160548-Pelagomonas_calceolata.AAC.3